MPGISFDPSDWDAMLKLSAEHEKYPEPLFGKTANNEDFMIEVNPDQISTQVFQENGWVRKNTYYPRDCISEETFEGRWKCISRKPQKHRDIDR